jgi:hypothetical protein
MVENEGCYGRVDVAANDQIAAVQRCGALYSRLGLISRNAGLLFFLLAVACTAVRNTPIDIASDGGGSATDAGPAATDAGPAPPEPMVRLPDGAADGPADRPGTAGDADAANGPGTDLPEPPERFRLIVTVQGDGRVVADGAVPLSCPGTCMALLDARSVVTLVATAAYGGAFMEWQGACAGTGPCRVTLTADISVTAVFRPYLAWRQGVGQYSHAALAVAGDQIYVTGEFTGAADFGGISATGEDVNDGFFAKYDGGGKIQWLKTFGSPGASFGTGVATGPSGDVVLTGYGARGANLDGMPLSPMAEQSLFIAWFSPAGQLQKLLTNTGAGAVVFDPSGNLVMSTPSSETHLVKFGADRQMLWSQPDWSGSVYPEGLAIDPAGNIVTCGSMFGPASIGGRTFTPLGATDVVLVRRTSAGLIQWVTTWGSVGGDTCDVAVDQQGDVYVVGGFAGGDLQIGGHSYPNAGEDDAYVAKFSGSSGAVSWVSVHGSTTFDHAHTILTDIRGGVLVAASGGFDLMAGRPFLGTSLLWLSPSTGAVTSAIDVGQFITRLARHSSGDIIFGGGPTVGRLWLP